MIVGLDKLPLKAQMMTHLKKMLSRMTHIFKRKKVAFQEKRVTVKVRQKRDEIMWQKKNRRCCATEFDLLQSLTIQTPLRLKFRGSFPAIKKLTSNCWIMVSCPLSHVLLICVSCSSSLCSIYCWMKIVAKVVALMFVYSSADIYGGCTHL